MLAIALLMGWGPGLIDGIQNWQAGRTEVELTSEEQEARTQNARDAADLNRIQAAYRALEADEREVFSGDAQRSGTANREEDRAELPEPDHPQPESGQLQSDELRQVARDLPELRRMRELDDERERLAEKKRAAERQKKQHGPGSESGWLDRRAAEKERTDEIGAELQAVNERHQQGQAWLKERFPTKRTGDRREALCRDVGKRLHEMPEQERGQLPQDLRERADTLASGHAERLQREQRKAIEKAAKEAGHDLGRSSGRSSRDHDRGMGMGM